MRVPPRRPGLQRPGEGDLRRLDWLTVAHAAPGIFAGDGPFATSVPSSHATSAANGTVNVACVCSAGLPLVVEPAHSALCDCGRLFVNIGKGDVRVGRVEGEE